MTDVKMSVKTTEVKRDKLDALAKEKGVSRTELLNNIIDSYLAWKEGHGSFAVLLAQKLED